MGAAVAALLRHETAYLVDRAATRAELDARDADVILTETHFLRAHGPLDDLPTVVLADPAADRAGLAELAPGARGWLPTTSTGEDLIATVDAAAERVRPKTVARPRAEPTEPPPSPRAAAALLALGVASGAAALSFLWLALRP